VARRETLEQLEERFSALLLKEVTNGIEALSSNPTDYSI